MDQLHEQASDKDEAENEEAKASPAEAKNEEGESLQDDEEE